MARRRRAFSSCHYSSASFSTVLFSFQERTSCPFLNFAQSRRRRFTDSKFGVSLLASDADPLRPRSLTPTAFAGSFSESSDLKSNGKSLVFITGDSGSSQIWRAHSISATLMLLVGRNLVSMFNRRFVSPPSCFSDSHSPTVQQLRSAAAPSVWCISRNVFHSQAAGLALGFQVLGLFWALQVMGQLLVQGLVGLMDQKHGSVSLQPNISSFLRCCRRLWSPTAIFIYLVERSPSSLSSLVERSFSSLVERSPSSLSSLMERSFSSLVERSSSPLFSFVERFISSFVESFTFPFFSFMEIIFKSSGPRALRAQCFVRVPSLAKELLSSLVFLKNQELKIDFSSINCGTSLKKSHIFFRDFILSFYCLVILSNLVETDSLAKSLVLNCACVILV